MFRRGPHARHWNFAYHIVHSARAKVFLLVVCFEFSTPAFIALPYSVHTCMETIEIQLFSRNYCFMITKIEKFLLQNVFLWNFSENPSSHWFGSFETKHNQKCWIFACSTKKPVFSNSSHACMSLKTNTTKCKLLGLKQPVSPSTFAFVQYPTWYARFQCREDMSSNNMSGRMMDIHETMWETKWTRILGRIPRGLNWLYLSRYSTDSSEI